MKNSSLPIWLFILLPVMTPRILCGQSNAYNKGAEAFEKAQIKWNSTRQSPTDIKFAEESTLVTSDFFDYYAQQFNLSEKNTFSLLREETDQMGFTHGRYKQFYNGIEVQNSMFVLHSRNGRVQHANGNLSHGIDLNTKPALSPASAAVKARVYLEQKLSGSDPTPGLETLLKKHGLGSAPGKLMIIPDKSGHESDAYRLVYRFDLVSGYESGRHEVLIDAHTGELVRLRSSVYHQNIPTRGYSLYNDTVDIVVSDTNYTIGWPESALHWHPNSWMALGDTGKSWYLADTTYFSYGTYDVLWHEALQTDPILLTGDTAYISFYQRFAVEEPRSVGGYDGQDGMNVQISLDGGLNWEVLVNPDLPYTCTSLSGFGENFNLGPGIPGWAGSMPEWTRTSFDLSSYLGDTISLRFVFGSNDEISTWSNPGLFGWQVDSLVVKNRDSTLFLNNGTGDNMEPLNLWHWSSEATGNYFLLENSRGIDIATLDTRAEINMSSFTGIGTDSLPIVAESMRNAVGIHFALESTYDYFMDRFGRNSYDNQGSSLLAYANWVIDGGQFNAVWYGNFAAFGSGDGSSITAFSSLDIIGHEIAHGVTQTSANLMYTGEQGALNESFSDIFGTGVEHFVEGEESDWLGAEDIFPGGGAIRSLEDPNAFSNPDTYLGRFWVNEDSPTDFGGVHINSSVQNHWFYLLSKGGSGTNDDGYAYDLQGIGIQDAEQIAYRNLTAYLIPTSGFTQAAYYAVQSADDLFGDTSTQKNETAEAWRAVGIYPEPTFIAPDSLDFSTKISNTQSRSFRITSKGFDPITLSNITAEGEGFELKGIPVLPHPMDEVPYLILNVSFSPDEARTYTGSIAFESNDPDDSVTYVYLTGLGEEIPDDLDHHVLSGGSIRIAPNPFTEETQITVTLEVPSELEVKIINQTGQILWQLPKRMYPAGESLLTWKGVTAAGGLVPPGLYFLVLDDGEQRVTRKIAKY